MSSIFIEISLIIIATVLVSALMRFLKQPLVIGYLLTGILLGPSVFNVVKSSEELGSLANVGIALLLFMVGLSLNPKVVKEMGKVSVLGGLGQVVTTFLASYGISLLFGFTSLTSMYIAIAVTFSSTIIIMKLLSDTHTIDSLPGRISVGMLIVQDFLAIGVLILISSTFGGDTNVPFFETALLGLGLVLGTFLIGAYVLPAATKFAAKSQEFLLLFSIGWSLALAAVFEIAGFSLEIGALLAGITLAMSPFRFEITAKMKPLRDFFLVLFFIFLGSQMVFARILEFMVPIMLLSAFILFVSPFIIIAILGYLGYSKKTSFIVGITLAQISEFSLILISLGYKVGHVSSEVLTLVAAVGLITIAGSSYFILYSEKLYRIFSPYLDIFERNGPKLDIRKTKKKDSFDVVLFGYNRIGYGLLDSFQKIKKKFLVVDYNPDAIKTLQKQRIPCIYGDASDTELLEEIDFSKIKMVFSSVPEIETNFVLLDYVRRENENAIIIVVSHQVEDALQLYERGATYVVLPHFLGGHYTANMIEDYGVDLEKFLRNKVQHIEHLKKRRKLGHDHPRHERD